MVVAVIVSVVVVTVIVISRKYAGPMLKQPLSICRLTIVAHNWLNSKQLTVA